ncbi:SRPBCC family protein [Tenacibaculum sp. nBUS_03]|uniref:SRPBCC family protein n=1 Tax=Tenacibaculum sp. nBUS_03 TaxID=3395320 RepID=UPI003EB92690
MLEFKNHSGIYTLEAEQVINVGLKDAWEFFSSPENLQRITPSHMGFKITSSVDKKVYAGQIITYKVSVLPGIQQNWVTEITQVKEQHFFIDEQRFGPYKMWHHEHWFKELPNGKTVMYDKISYKIPFGFLGVIAQSLFIKKQLTAIFEHRFKTLETLFNAK